MLPIHVDIMCDIKIFTINHFSCGFRGTSADVSATNFVKRSFLQTKMKLSYKRGMALSMTVASENPENMLRFPFKK